MVKLLSITFKNKEQKLKMAVQKAKNKNILPKYLKVYHT